ncbi:MAG: C45 family peptidase [Bacteroidales bacterium]|nr:C45 family peptidase [Bacteroidales bacterium]
MKKTIDKTNRENISIQDVKQHFEGGCFVEKNGIKIVNLNGSWRAMGRQYGELVKRYITEVYNFVLAKVNEDEEKMQKVTLTANKLFKNYPTHHKDFFAGMEETSRLTMSQLLIANAVEYAEVDFSCSAIATWDEYAKNGLLYGRNYDGLSFTSLKNDILITVFHPDDSQAFAIVGYAGEIYSVNGLNESGLFIELNNGMPSAGFDIDWEQVPSTSKLMELARTAKNLDDIDHFFKTEKSFSAFLIGVTDAHEARSYEWCINGMKRGDTQTPNGLMIQTNHYVNEEWNYRCPSDNESWGSLQRRSNLLHQAKEYCGMFDIQSMQEIMSTPLEKGGACNEFTLYQLIVEPSTLTLWIRIPHHLDWKEVNMKSFLTVNG